MAAVCQACGYERKPSDQAPDWECPSCGKAYAKTSHEVPSPLVTYADSSFPGSVSQLHGGGRIPERFRVVAPQNFRRTGNRCFGFANQTEKLKKMVPNLEDFSRTTSISGIYSYKQYGRNIVTRIDEKIIHCSVDYGGGTGSCFVPLKHVPPNSRITADVASVKTTSGITLYPIGIKVDDQVIYAVTPEKSLREWWFGSRLGLLTLPMILLRHLSFYRICILYKAGMNLRDVCFRPEADLIDWDRNKGIRGVEWNLRSSKNWSSRPYPRMTVGGLGTNWTGD